MSADICIPFKPLAPMQQRLCHHLHLCLLSWLQCEHLLQRLEVLKDHLLSVEKFINAELDHRCACP